MQTIKTAEYLRYQFTRAEMSEHALNLARKNQELAELDLRQKHLQADINAAKKSANEAIAQLAGWISHGHDYRMVPCEVKFNDPVDGKKTTYRTDTYGWVKTADMDAKEIAKCKQQGLPFDGVPCATCMPTYFNGQNVLVDGPSKDCPTCGGSGKQPEAAATTAAGTNGAEVASEPTPSQTEPAAGEPGSVVDAEFPEVEPEVPSGPANASQAEMSRAAKTKGKRA